MSSSGSVIIGSYSRLTFTSTYLDVFITCTQQSVSSENLKIIDVSGNKKAEFNNVPHSSVVAAFIVGSDKLFIGGYQTTSILKYTLQFSTSPDDLTALTYTSTSNPSGAVYRAVLDPGLTYIYITDLSTLYKVDFSTESLDLSLTESPHLSPSDAIGLLLYCNDMIIDARRSQKLYFAYKNNLSAFKLLTHSVMTTQAVLETDFNWMYALTGDNTPTYFQKMDLVASYAGTAIVTSCTSSSVVPIGVYSKSIANLGTFKICATAFSNSALAYIVLTSKINCELYSGSTIVGESFAFGIEQYYLEGFYPQTNVVNGVTEYRFYFGIVLSSGFKNFQSYYLSFTDCENRDFDGVCLQCPTGKYRSSLSYLNKCLSPAEFPIGAFGADIAQNLVAPCASNCLQCTTDIRYCSSCDTTNQYYLDIRTNTCLHKTLFPPGYGVSGTNMLECAASSGSCGVNCCDDCKNTIATCVSCQTVNGYFMDTSASPNACLHYNSAPSRMGGDLVTKNYIACQDGSCAVCGRRYTECTLCDPGKYVFNSVCLATAPPAHGVSPQGMWAPCADPHCINCINNYQICTECDTANGYNVVNGACATPSPIIVKVIDFLADEKKFWVEFDLPVQVNPSQLMITFYDNNAFHAPTVNLCNLNRCSIELDPLRKQGFSVKINVDQNIIDGILEITKNSFNTSTTIVPIISEDRMRVFKDYPILKQNCTISTSTPSSIVNSAYTSVNILRMISTIFKSSATPLASLLLDRLFSDFLYLLLLSGVFLELPDSILRKSSIVSILPFEIPDPLKEWVDEESQENLLSKPLPVPFERCSVERHLFSNMGQDLIIFAFLLLINIVITVTTELALRYANRKNKVDSQQEIVNSIIDKNEKEQLAIYNERLKFEKNSESDKSVSVRVCTYIRQSYGIRYLLMRLEGVQLELMIYSCLHLSMYFSQAGLRIVVGTVVSLALLSYNIWANLTLAKLAHFVYNQFKMIAYYSIKKSKLLAKVKKSSFKADEKVEETSKASRSRSCSVTSQKIVIREGSKEKNSQKLELLEQATQSLKEQDLAEIVDLERVPAHYLAFHFEDLLAPQRRGYLFLSNIRSVRAFVTSLCLVCWPNYPTDQLTAILFFETMYLLYSLKANIKAVRSEFWVEFTLDALRILYLLLKLSAEFAIMSMSAKQNVIGGTMAVVLVLMVAVAVAFELYSISALIYSAISNLCKATKKKGSKPPTQLHSDSKVQYHNNHSLDPETKIPTTSSQPLFTAPPTPLIKQAVATSLPKAQRPRHRYRTKLSTSPLS